MLPAFSIGCDHALSCDATPEVDNSRQFQYLSSGGVLNSGQLRVIPAWPFSSMHGSVWLTFASKTGRAGGFKSRMTAELLAPFCVGTATTVPYVCHTESTNVGQAPSECRC
jgi:hypothetical protein